MLTKNQKNILKKNYLKKIPMASIAEIERFLNIIKKQKIFNKKISEIKKGKNIYKNIEDAYFMSKYTNLKICENSLSFKLLKTNNKK